ncbi:Hypothetical protein PHPALM_3178 [Phytophthora palmivora]|uniref:DDE Tnp4 domain-containing protein n=1 Tax=Phytophthora palmivora TaxID=4796 RepID=A0A2P4YN14_9STRA|nr:Hypothetical protein PHPALM_3178 [Phytophthora palmivora]
MGMNESALLESVNQLSAFLVGMLNELVTFPDNRAEWRRIEEQFNRKNGIPGVVGADDGSLFAMQRHGDYDGFYCRKGYTAINMQAIVDADLKFMGIDMYPGSWSDKGMWMYAPSSRAVRAHMPIETHLLGDSGYTLYPWVLTPYMEHEEGGELSQRKKDFDFAHSSTRMSEEIAFGRLKGRFWRLKTVKAEKTSVEYDEFTFTLFLHCSVVTVSPTMVEIVEAIFEVFVANFE